MIKEIYIQLFLYRQFGCIRTITYTHTLVVMQDKKDYGVRHK